MLKPYKSWDVYHQLVQDFATIHGMLVVFIAHILAVY
jgi:ABC-type oligopeptide transport system ATPase subunit